MPFIKPLFQAHRHPTSSPHPTLTHDDGSAACTQTSSRPVSPSIDSQASRQSSNSSTAPSHSNSKPISTIGQYCYPFFLEHLHYPYPTASQKRTIVKEADAPEVTSASVSTWFSNSRRRCGWIDICNELCEGDQTAMASLCTRVFKALDPSTLQTPKGAVEKILTMRNKVVSWHEEQNKPSPWAVALYDLLQQFSILGLTGIDQTLADNKLEETSSEKEQEKKEHVRIVSPSTQDGIIDVFDQNLSTDTWSHIPSSPKVQPAFNTIPFAGQKRPFAEEEELRFPLSTRCISISSDFSETSDSASSVNSSLSSAWFTDDESRPSKRFRLEQVASNEVTSAPSQSDETSEFSAFLECPFTFVSPNSVASSNSITTPPEHMSAQMKRSETPVSLEHAEELQDDMESRPAKRIKLATTVAPISASQHFDSWPFASFQSEPDPSNPVFECEPGQPLSPSMDLSFFNWEAYNTEIPAPTDECAQWLTELMQTSPTAFEPIDSDKCLAFSELISESTQYISQGIDPPDNVEQLLPPHNTFTFESSWGGQHQESLRNGDDSLIISRPLPYIDTPLLLPHGENLNTAVANIFHISSSTNSSQRDGTIESVITNKNSAGDRSSNGSTTVQRRNGKSAPPLAADSLEADLAFLHSYLS